MIYNKVKSEPSPISGMLRRLQTNAGWGELVSENMKRRMIDQLERIALDDTTPPQTQVAAIACTIRASTLELDSINTMVRLYETTELERRINELHERIEPTTEPDFIELEPTPDTLDVITGQDVT
jgi:hypothetical protein